MIVYIVALFLAKSFVSYGLVLVFLIALHPHFAGSI